MAIGTVVYCVKLILDSISYCNTVKDTISWILNQFHDYKTDTPEDCKDLIYSLFVAVPFSLCKDKLKLTGRPIPFSESDIQRIISPASFDEYYSRPPHLRDAWIHLKYTQILLEIHAAWDSSNTLFTNEQDGAFSRLVTTARNEWNTSVSYARNRYPALSNFIDANMLEGISRQIDQPWKPQRYYGGDAVIFRKMVSDKHYVSETILFDDNDSAPTVMKVRPDVLTASDYGATFENSNRISDWWNVLAVHLESPLFLFGPGGVGKSAFLAYLYDSITKNSENPTPFSGVFVLSLESLVLLDLSQYDNGGIPFADPDRSLLLSRIASRSGCSTDCKQWKRAFETGEGLWTNKPILLLLDGLNELRQSNNRSQLYRQILQEISTLSQYRYVRIIITSRVEDRIPSTGNPFQMSRTLSAQLQDFNTANLKNVQVAKLMGIEPDIVKNLLFDYCIDESSALALMLQRPLYYNYIISQKYHAEFLNSRYSLLQGMYNQIYHQSILNCENDDQRIFRTYVYKVFLPIFAHVIQRGNLIYDIAFEKSCAIAIQQISLNIAGDLFQLYTANDKTEFVKSKLKKIRSFLETQEQILIIDDEGYISFSHQDYRDFLAALFFIQRLEYIRKRIDNPVMKSDESLQLDTLRLNTYTFDVLRLIYDGLSFSTNFVEHFSIGNDHQVSWESLMWYTTIYQLSDLRILSQISYSPHRNLSQDTLTLLSPFCQVVDEELRISPKDSEFFYLKPTTFMVQSVIEILMKACELYRNSSDYTSALHLTSVAQNFCMQLRKIRDPEGQRGANLMQCVVNYNIARIRLSQFTETLTPESLDSALQDLYDGTKGTPFRFSCNALALMIVSPQPILAATLQYRTFIRRHHLNVVSAFWMYYNGLFDKRKKGEDWLPRKYCFRQLLFLLAENKVKVDPLSNWDPVRAVQGSLSKEKPAPIGGPFPFPIVMGSADDPIPGVENLRLIQSIVNEIWHMEYPFKHYLAGLVEAELHHNISRADAEMRAAYMESDQKDLKAKLWLDYFQGNLDEMDHTFQEMQEQAESAKNKSLEMSSYNLYAYFDRDNKPLYQKLRERLIH